jgi:hypothetical protein
MICPKCDRALELIGETILACLQCFSRRTAEHNVQILILRATLGIMCEPIMQAVVR